ncbi:FAD/NAD(P)-binding domain-containing protein [Coniophora puteana RWD-64-598 SS2]|uniref:FAD/NAD(P)-binding domain-containing protein n=1 Tax=Coniophora puteana (strain RWD-64-598) TaxID=741705 RepID=A0A5M3MSK7_CONPW|nr:FAD/NAD(P)-binding domain-containing protein [Coniophora puteana RWD-64-598 SS2]EIW82149.1 FAD/NAD(P)-binding domain-containing protein [Coniophora puteana RWD-64-598 SS2]
MTITSTSTPTTPSDPPVLIVNRRRANRPHCSSSDCPEWNSAPHVDKETSFHPGSRGPGIQPRTQELLHQLGMSDMLNASIETMQIQRHSYDKMDAVKTWAVIPPLESTPHIPYINPRLLGQNGIEKFLRAALARLGYKVELGYDIRSFEQTPECVIVHAFRRDGSEETFRASYLTGADGGRGVSRKQLGATFLGETREENRLVTGDVRMTAEGFDKRYWHRFGDSNKKLVMLRHCAEVAEENDGYQFQIMGPEVDIHKLLSSKESLFEEIASALPMKIHFTSLICSSEWRPNIRMANNFGSQRAFLAGDAAHVHSPAGGQGLNTGISDAKISLVMKGGAGPSLLATYSAERLPLVAEMLNLTTTILDADTFGSDATWSPRPESLRMLGVNYRQSDIVLDEIHPLGSLPPIPAYGDPKEIQAVVLAAGDRAPEAGGLIDDAGNTHRLFDLFHMTHHTVLVFALSVEDARDILAARTARSADLIRYIVILPGSSQLDAGVTLNSDALIVQDSEGIAYSGYQAENDKTRVAIVRPDGWIGGLVRDKEGAHKYFTKIFE